MCVISIILKENKMKITKMALIAAAMSITAAPAFAAIGDVSSPVK
jgi:hypothetical protein